MRFSILINMNRNQYTAKPREQPFNTCRVWKLGDNFFLYHGADFFGRPWSKGGGVTFSWPQISTFSILPLNIGYFIYKRSWFGLFMRGWGSILFTIMMSMVFCHSCKGGLSFYHVHVPANIKWSLLCSPVKRLWIH